MGRPSVDGDLPTTNGSRHGTPLPDKAREDLATRIARDFTKAPDDVAIDGDFGFDVLKGSGDGFGSGPQGHVFWTVKMSAIVDKASVHPHFQLPFRIFRQPAQNLCLRSLVQQMTCRQGQDLSIW